MNASPYETLWNILTRFCTIDSKKSHFSILAIKIAFFFIKDYRRFNAMPQLWRGGYPWKNPQNSFSRLNWVLGSSCNLQYSWILQTHGANNLMASIRPWRVLKSELNYVLVLRSMGFCSDFGVSNHNSTSFGISIFKLKPSWQYVHQLTANFRT